MAKFRRRPILDTVEAFVWAGDVHAFVRWLESLEFDYWLVKYEAGKACYKLWFHVNREHAGIDPPFGNVIVWEGGSLRVWTPERFAEVFEAVGD